MWYKIKQQTSLIREIDDVILQALWPNQEGSFRAVFYWPTLSFTNVAQETKDSLNCKVSILDQLPKLDNSFP